MSATKIILFSQLDGSPFLPHYPHLNADVITFYKEDILVHFDQTNFKTQVYLSDQTSISDYQAVLFRVSGTEFNLLFSKVLQHHFNLYTSPPFYATETCLIPSKALQSYYLNQNHVPAINSWAGCGAAFLKSTVFQSQTAFPYIIKVSVSGEGKGVYLVTDQSTAAEIFQRHADEILLCQPYVENNFEVRVLVVGDQSVWSASRRAGESDFRNNVAQGGSIVPFTATPAQKTQATKAARAVHYDTAGVDMVYNQTTDQWLIMEINSVPGLKAWTKYVPVSSDEKIIEFLVAQSVANKAR